MKKNFNLFSILLTVLALAFGADLSMAAVAAGLFPVSADVLRGALPPKGGSEEPA